MKYKNKIKRANQKIAHYHSTMTSLHNKRGGSPLKEPRSFSSQKVPSKEHDVQKDIMLLTKKGLKITQAEPITRRYFESVPPNPKSILKQFKKYLDRNKLNTMAVRMGEFIVGAANTISLLENHPSFSSAFDNFKDSNPHIMRWNKVPRTVIVLAPYSIGLPHGLMLGNKSWGRIDFLTNHAGFTLVKQ